jgi:hypothetical protein
MTDWPRCPNCGDYALDGQATCGRPRLRAGDSAPGERDLEDEIARGPEEPRFAATLSLLISVKTSLFFISLLPLANCQNNSTSEGVNGESALSNWRDVTTRRHLQRGTLLGNFQYEEVLSAA